MRDYDWSFGFGFGTRYPIRRSRYDQGGAGGGHGRSPMGGGSQGFGRGSRGGYGSQGGYDRGTYGENHPGFGGIPGGRREGMYYGGGYRRQQGGYGQGFERGGGWGRPGADYPRREQQQRGGYGDEYARQPFLPENAYHRHPELSRPRQQGDRGDISQYGVTWTADDAEIEYGVRQNLYQDSYIDADRIEVEVDEGVVTLRGEVDDYLQARYAWDDAWETEGVHGVVNLLTVRTDQPATDAGTQAQKSPALPGEVSEDTSS